MGITRAQLLAIDVPLVEISGADHESCILRREFCRAIRDYLDQQSGFAARTAK